MLDYHYDDFLRLSEFPIELEMTTDPWADAYFSHFASHPQQSHAPQAPKAETSPVRVMLWEGLKAHIDAGSQLAEHLRDAMALLLWADENQSAIA